jgi:MFS transporter, SP family, sugar:H+ symporter
MRIAMIPKVYFVAFITCLGGFTFGYDVGIVSGVLIVPLFKQLMGITNDNEANLSGNIASVLQLGGFFGVITQPYINDRFGRKVCIMLNCVLFIAGGNCGSLRYG